MTVKFDVKMTEKAMYDFMLHTTYTSLNGIMGVILGGITLYLGIRQTMNGVYPAAATFFLIAIFFLVGTPLNMKAKSSEQVKKSPMFQKPITYELTEEGVQISQEDQSTLNEWGNFQKAVSTDTSIILYVTKVRALIFPKEALGEQYAAAVKMISTHMSPRKVKIRHVSADKQQIETERSSMVIETRSAKETFLLGEKIGKEARAGQVYTLIGDLGVGKTVFTQGMAKGLGIKEPVSSPTFTIVQVYEEGRLPFYHFDVYRIGDVEEMDEIGFDDYIYGDGVSLIEWANLIEEILPEKRTEIIIEKDLKNGFEFRRITVEER